MLWAAPGTALVLVGLLADQLQGRASDGLGPRQMLIVLTGVVAVLAGLFLSRRVRPTPRVGQAGKLSVGKKFVFAAIIVLGFTMLLESAAWIALYTQQRQQPFLFAWHRPPKQRQLGQAGKDRLVQMSYLDPHLGYGHNPQVLPEFKTFPGFAVYGDPTSPTAIRIFALGGSTTDPVSMPEGNWPRYLQQELSAAGVECVVFNGGVGGYSSSQEFLKLVRDVLPLDPDVVVALNGINDMDFIHGVKDHPMVNPYQAAIMRHMARPGFALFPNVVRLLSNQSIEGVSLGTRVKVSDVQQWWRNVRLAHAVTSEFGVAYVCCLQPTLGVGSYAPTPREQAMLARKPPDYVPAVKEFFAGAIPLIENASFGVNLVEVLKDSQDVYADPRHPNSDGNLVIGQAIADYLLAKELIHPLDSHPHASQPTAKD